MTGRRALLWTAANATLTVLAFTALWWLWTPNGCTRADLFGRCPDASTEIAGFAVIAVAVTAAVNCAAVAIHLRKRGGTR